MSRRGWRRWLPRGRRAPSGLFLRGIGYPVDPRFAADDVAELLDRAAEITDDDDGFCPLCGSPIAKHPGHRACDRYPTTSGPQR